MSDQNKTEGREPVGSSELLGRVMAMLEEAQALSGEIEASGQYVAAHAFDDVLHGLRKTKSVWNHAL